MIIEGGRAIDNRGKVSFVNSFDFKNIKRFYMVENSGSEFRGWHGHTKESKYVFVASGVAYVGVANLKTDEVSWFTLRESEPQILHIPAGHANGFKALRNNTRVIFYSNKTLEESKNDDFRFPPERWPI